MKKILVGASALLLMASCQVRTATSEVLPIETTLTSKNTAELDVQPQKISYEYVPTRTERKMGKNFVKRNAVAVALEKNGNADVLVNPQYVITEKRLLLRSKLRSVKVTGYPAVFKNVKPSEPDKIIVHQMVKD